MKDSSGYDEPSQASALALIGHALALDFANTASGRGGSRYREHLQTEEDVVRWAHHAGILGAADLTPMLAELASAAGPLQNLLVRAQALRQGIYQVMAALAEGRAPDPADLDAIAAIHTWTLSEANLCFAGGECRWLWAGGTAAALLGPIALSAVELLTSAEGRIIKQCPAEDCGWLFLDRSRSHSRRWCEMEVCGNRAKARRHARRQAHRHAHGEGSGLREGS